MIISEYHCKSQRMTWIPDPPKDSVVIDTGTFYDSTLIYCMSQKEFLLPTFFFAECLWVDDIYHS